MFAGSPERYDWKLIGKKEIYVPYNGYRQVAKVAEFVKTNNGKEFFTPGQPNPDYWRWEKHRMWIVEGTLKKDKRHVYGKRIFFVLYLVAVIMSGSIVFQAIGKAVPAFITSIARPVLFLIPLIFTLPRFFQLDGIWLAFPITDGLTFLVVLAFLIPEIRRFRRLSRQQQLEP